MSSLTLDAELQSYVMARVEGKSAGVVVMDIWTGDILALASAPGFDPNPFSDGPDTCSNGRRCATTSSIR